MRCFKAKTSDGAWRKAAKALQSDAASRQMSRLGWTREILHSSFEIEDPRQRWVYSRTPPINPAFAIAEVIWILSGRNDSAFLNFWNPALPKFAGEGEIYHGAYGHRLRNSHGLDQIERAYKALSKNPDSRQVVLQIWDSEVDLPDEDGIPSSADVPCNISAMLKVRDGKLEWTQVMRSNDLFLGSPHNFIQFTMMQEIIAGWLGLEPGTYIQFSDSLHCYEHDLDKFGASEYRKRPRNSETLSLPKEQFDATLNAFSNAMDRLRDPTLTTVEFSRIVNVDELPAAYKNLLIVVAADAARRRGWQDEMKIAVRALNNKSLELVWMGWADKHSG